jgi:hypothetical protein
MALEQLPLDQLTTAAGVAAAAIAIRQIIEMVKGSFLPWLDAGNERKGAIILAAVVYVAWLALYGKNLGTDGPAAFAAFVACSTAALGTNEAVDAAKGVVAKNVVQTVGSDPVVATEAVKTGVISQETAAASAAGAAGAAAGTASEAAGAVKVDPDASTEADDVSSAAADADGGGPLEAGPDVDLNVNGGDPLDDDDEDDEGPFDPATIGTL